MAKRHYIPITADVPGAASQGNCAFIRKVIRTALQEEGMSAPCEVDVLLTGDDQIHQINLEMRQVDRATMSSASRNSTWSRESCPQRRTQIPAPG